MRDQFLKWCLFILRSAVPSICACCEPCGHSLPLFSRPMMAKSLNPWGSLEVPLGMCDYERVINNVTRSPLSPPLHSLARLFCASWHVCVWMRIVKCSLLNRGSWCLQLYLHPTAYYFASALDIHRLCNLSETLNEHICSIVTKKNVPCCLVCM